MSQGRFHYNALPKGSLQMVRFIFVVYCATVGVVLILAPWTPGWEYLVARLPFSGLRFLDMPWIRGGLSGFGLVHLVWGIHDLNELVRQSFKPDDPQHPQAPRHH